MNSQTRRIISLENRIFGQILIKQKLNSKSSIIKEAIIMVDIFPYNIWMRIFLEAQGYIFNENTLYQDNQSETRAKKGMISYEGNSRHIV